MYDKDYIMSFLYKEKDGKQVKSISGWWSDSLFEVLETLHNVQQQNEIKGNLCETGTWCGRSFIPLRNFLLEDETCYGIDVFYKEEYRTELKENLIKVFETLDNCVIIKTDSTRMQTNEFTPVRIFHVDGDHSTRGALGDLNLAANNMHRAGIIMVDDYNNSRYGQDVRKAIDQFAGEFQIAFTSCQKLFMCRSHMIETYVDAMRTLSWEETVEPFYPVTEFSHPRGLNSWKELNSC